MKRACRVRNLARKVVWSHLVHLPEIWTPEQNRGLEDLRIERMLLLEGSECWFSHQSCACTHVVLDHMAHPSQRIASPDCCCNAYQMASRVPDRHDAASARLENRDLTFLEHVTVWC